MDAALKMGNKYTIKDIYALPEGKRAELIYGQMYMMAPPKRKHQKLLGCLYKKIADYIDGKSGNCEVYPAPFAVHLFADDKTYVEPDISVICDKGKLDEMGCNGAPDWIIEIVSPGNASHDYLRKINLYSEAGVREYWIVDYEEKRIMIYNFEYENEKPDICTFSDKVRAGIYEDFEIDFDEINME